MPGDPPQASTAFARLQTLPQAPQFWTVLSAVSQVNGSLSQSPESGSQSATAHVPPAHVSIAFESEHGVPQLPQSVRLSSETSQPSVTSALQSS
jgi:hypothetical protein